MESACKGASKAGGIAIGILPGDRKETANPYVTIPVVTAMGTTRNTIIVRTADALIAVDGNFGTLTEIVYSLDMKKPLALLKSWPVEKLGVDPSLFRIASTPEEAVEFVFEAVEKRIAAAKP